MSAWELAGFLLLGIATVRDTLVATLATDR
jgi:hypothetical protein